MTRSSEDVVEDHDPREIVFLSKDHVKGMLSVGDAMEAVEQDLVRQATDGAAAIGLPSVYAQEDRSLGFMWRLKTATIRTLPVAGVRIAGFKLDQNGIGSGGDADSTRYLILSDPSTGKPLAIVDEHWSFGMRTAAAAAVAAKFLAKRNPRSIGIIGVGHIGRMALRCLHHTFDIKDVRVTSLREETRRVFAEEMGEQLGLNIAPCDSVQAVCRHSDIIFACTSSQTPYIALDWLRKGTFLASLGQEELMHDAYAGCDRLFIDYDSSRDGHPAHIQAAIRSGALRDEDIAGVLYEVVSGLRPGRTDESERIILAAVGLATQDIAIAHRLYQKAKTSGAGLRLPF